MLNRHKGAIDTNITFVYFNKLEFDCALMGYVPALYYTGIFYSAEH